MVTAPISEAAFDHIRRSEFLDLAPRLGSVCCFPTLQRMIDFANETRAKYATLFRYEFSFRSRLVEGSVATTVDMAISPQWKEPMTRQ